MIIPEKMVISKIYLIRGMKVMLDKDLAELYGVSTGNFNKGVKRNIKRFPDDFMFRLTKKEFDNLIFQIGTSSWGGTRKLPNAFTEQGVAMLSSVLHSERAIMVNIKIIRVFIDYHCDDEVYLSEHFEIEGGCLASGYLLSASGGQFKWKMHYMFSSSRIQRTL